MAAAASILPDENINFAHRDPFAGRQWGPLPAHVALTWAVLVGVIYWPTHRLLLRLFPRSEVERRR
jgi:hypothetical protein